MPLILLSGFPCSGLTYRASQLSESLSAKIADSASPIKQIVVISNHALNIPRSCYATARAEKDARAAFYSEVKRHLLRADTIIIADGLNYIKGYRYQLFCEAKAARTTSCVVHIGTRSETCTQRNSDRLQTASAESIGGPLQEDPYEEETFKNLVFRYEEPNGMARWDSPLFTVVEEDIDVPTDAIWTALVGDSSEGTGSKVVRPHAATVIKPATQADYLYELDKTTSAVVSQIIAWQKDHEGEGGGEVNVSTVPTTGSTDGEDAKGVVSLPANGVTMPMLQRIKRQFVTLNRQHTLDKRRVGPLFVDYLNDQFSA